jgi:hypothetical protein
VVVGLVTSAPGAVSGFAGRFLADGVWGCRPKTGTRPVRDRYPKGRDASGGSVSVANRARRREAADGKKLEGERGHWLKCVAENLRKFGIIAQRTTTFRRARAARRVISIKVQRP